MKKILSMILLVAMALSIFPICSMIALAGPFDPPTPPTDEEGRYTSGYFKYLLSSGKAAICLYTGPGGTDLVIPASLGGYPVVSLIFDAGAILDAYPFMYHTPRTVTLPTTITNLNYWSLNHDGTLESVYFLGNAPTVDGGYLCGYPTKVYYLAGTTGYTTPNWMDRPCEPFNGVNITFDANGGTGGVGATFMIPGLTLSAPTITKTGYTYASWSPAVPSTVPAENTTYTAQWTARTFAVTFNSQSGTVTPTFSTVTYDSAYGAGTGGFPRPVRSGYTFGGWFTSTNGAGTQIFSTTIAARTSSQILYAKWTVNQYTITFDANGGAGGTSGSIAYGAALTAPAVTKTGYVFTGWSQTVPATVGSEDATYTAQWNLLGDIGSDNTINALDALIALRASSGTTALTDTQKLFADVSKDGKVNSLDALMILKYASGKITSFE